MKTGQQPKTPVDRIAVDTSIWLKALLFGGSAEELIKMSLSGKVQVLTTEVQFLDLSIVLRERLGFSETAVAELRIFMEECSTIVDVPKDPAAGPGGTLPSLLRAAKDSGVSAIATSDRSKLTKMTDFEGIPIVTVS